VKTPRFPLAVVTLLLAGLATPTPPAFARQAPAAPKPAWQASVEKTLDAPLFQHASVGVLVRSLDTGQVLYVRNPDLALMPASNQKILTGAVALAKLGAEFRYRTILSHTGSVDRDGTLNGDLYLKGSGDPSLDSERLLTMVRALKGKGIRKLNGRIVADASAFDARTLGSGWAWDNETYYYSAQVAGLNCDENVLLLEVRPGKNVGDRATVVIGGPNAEKLGFAQSRYVAVTNEVKTVAAAESGSASVSAERVRGRNEVRLSGTMPAGAAQPQNVVVTVEDPALFAGTRLAELLPVGGVAVPSPDLLRVETGVTPAEAVEIAVDESPALPQLLKDFLKPSDNLYGEALLKTVGLKAEGKGTIAAGATALRKLLTEAGIDTGGLSVADGSGLSRMNTLTPRLVTDLLIHVWTKYPPADRDAFVAALPEAGVDGTLRSRMKQTAAAGKVYAKTGTLTRVSALSGYLTAKSGERMVFSIVMNHYGGSASAARGAQDAIVLALTEVPGTNKVSRSGDSR